MGDGLAGARQRAALGRRGENSLINLSEAKDKLAEMREVDSDEGVANACYNLAMAYIQRKRWKEAAGHLDEAHYLCRTLENREGLALVNLRLADVALGLGRPDLVLDQLANPEEFFRETGDRAGRLSVLERQAQALTGLGRLEEAADTLTRALDLAGDDVSLLLLSQYLAQVERSRGRRAEALVLYKRVGALAEKINEPQRLALALVAVGTLEWELGDAGAGRRYLELARDKFTALGQKETARQVEEEMARLSRE